MSYFTRVPWQVVAADWDEEGRARYTLSHHAVAIPDARLIAAAPELLDGLKNCLELIESLKPENPAVNLLREAGVSSYRKLIAKVEGTTAERIDGRKK